MSTRSHLPGRWMTLIFVFLACQIAPAATPVPHLSDPPAAAPAAPPPSPEHAVLHRLLGEWSARMEVIDGNGNGPDRIGATEVVRSCCDGLFVLTELRGKGRKAERGGRGILGYDPARGRYILTWADAQSTSLAMGEGDHDQASDAITFEYELPDGTGGTRRVRDRFAWEGPDRRSRTVSIVGVDGSIRTWITIQYRRE